MEFNMVNFPQPLPLRIVPYSLIFSTCLACGDTGLCDPVLVTVILSSPEATYWLHLLLMLDFSSLDLILLRRKINLGRGNREWWEQGSKFYMMWLGRASLRKWDLFKDLQRARECEPIWRTSVPSRENSKCKGPFGGSMADISEGLWGICVAEMEWPRQRAIGGQGQRGEEGRRQHTE